MVLQILATSLCNNPRQVSQAEKRYQHGDLAFIKELAQNVLSVLERPACSLERLETPEGDANDGQNLIMEKPDSTRSQPELSSDLITETTVLANPDSGICEIPEILESASNAIESLHPVRKPCKSDYETSKLISGGAFGAVYLVHHKDSDQTFAMKKMDKRSLDTPKEVERAFLERDILAYADCPFVVSLLCSFPTKSHLCIVMEYVGGGDCMTLLSTRGPLSVPLARLYFAEVVIAVEYLHSYGVMHRDLKPDNLLITSDGHIKVTDFGLSKLGRMIPKTNIHQELAEDIAREFCDREFCGTPSYVAPEVILEQGYGRPVDWWSMGIILHEFLVGSVPFHGNSVEKLFERIVSGYIIWDCDSAPSPDSQNLITELLRTNPAHRLGTGGAGEIKEHPFLSKVNFDNLLSEKPEYVPELISNVDTSFFIDHSDMYLHIVSEEEEDTSEDNDSLEFQNFTSSSERLSKLCATATRTMSNEDPKSQPDCSPESITEISEMQKEVSPSVSDRDDAMTSVPLSSPLSDFPAQEERKSSTNLIKEQQKSENVEQVKKRRGSIFCRILSSCRRGLSRAARIFAGCCSSTEVI